MEYVWNFILRVLARRSRSLITYYLFFLASLYFALLCFGCSSLAHRLCTRGTFALPKTLGLMQISHENESEHDIDIEVVGVGLASEDWDFRSFAAGTGPNPAYPAEVRISHRVLHYCCTRSSCLVVVVVVVFLFFFRA